MIQIKISNAIYTLKDGQWTGDDKASAGLLQIINNQQAGLAKDYSPAYGEPEVWFAGEIVAFVGGEVGEFTPEDDEPGSPDQLTVY